ncbi:TPA: glycosyltransferase family 4 protein, partial [Escherichia coli]|nr:glycosyltransferase family 4 protein [Escherichia coli]HAZ6997576.1 glycosyltransferase family 4 protein [Escherichia coli]
MRSFLKEHPHNILHSHGITADMFSYFLNGVKISTIHNRLDEDYIPLFGAVKGNAIYYLHRFILRRFNHIVACSAAVQSKLKQSKVKTKITTIQNGIDITRFKTLESDKKKLLREKHGFD